MLEREEGPLSGSNNPDQYQAQAKRCLSCGIQHFEDGFDCAECEARKAWKPEHWDEYHQQQNQAKSKVISVGFGVVLPITLVLIAILLLKMTVFRPPTQTEIFTAQGESFYEHGQYLQAIQSYESALQYEPLHAAGAVDSIAVNLRWRIGKNYELLGQGAFLAGQYDNALADAQQASVYAPLDSEIQANLAQCASAVSAKKAAESSAMNMQSHQTAETTVMPSNSLNTWNPPQNTSTPSPGGAEINDQMARDESASCVSLSSQVTQIWTQIRNLERDKPDVIDYGSDVNNTSYQLAMLRYQEQFTNLQNQQSQAQQQQASMGCSN